MKTTLIAMLLLVAGACQNDAPAVHYDEAASKAYMAAWQKRQAAGDGADAAWRAELKQIVDKFPHTRAGERAKELLAAPPAPATPPTTKPSTPTTTSPTPPPSPPAPDAPADMGSLEAPHK